MRTFTDTAGRTWTVAVTVTSLKRVKALTGHELLSIVGGELLKELYADPVKLCDIMFALCSKEAEEKGIDDEAFGAAMAGDALEDALKALLEDVIAFFLNPKERKALTMALAKGTEAAELVRSMMVARAEALTPEKLAEEAAKTLAIPMTGGP